MAGQALLATLAISACAPSPAPPRAGPPVPTVTRDEDGCAWRVCLMFDDAEDARIYIVENEMPVPATVRLDFNTLRNLRTDVSFPVEAVVPALTRGILLRLEAEQPGRPFEADPSVYVDLGSSTTRPDVEYLYTVPFGGLTPREIIQGFNGTDTHQLGMRYALDFAMPEETPILASRAGVVMYTQDGFTRGGRNPDLFEQANLVVVAHEDGSMATYGHLSPGLTVQVGDTVQQGQLLGLSGMTGFTGTPHLHFHVGVRMLGDPGRTIPIRIKDRNGVEFFPQEGSFIAPGQIYRAEGG